MQSSISDMHRHAVGLFYKALGGPFQRPPAEDENDATDVLVQHEADSHTNNRISIQTPRATLVEMAAPSTPKAGKPNLPKIKM